MAGAGVCSEALRLPPPKPRLWLKCGSAVGFVPKARVREKAFAVRLMWPLQGRREGGGSYGRSPPEVWIYCCFYSLPISFESPGRVVWRLLFLCLDGHSAL